MAAKKVRFTIEVDDVPRKLLSIVERTNGDLVFGVPAAADLGYVPGNDKTIRQQKFSIHVSPRSFHCNTIKQTLLLDNGQLITSYHKTTALKLDTGFAPVFFRRCPDLSLARYALSQRDKGERISLGGLDHRRYNLIYGVFVGRPDRFMRAPDHIAQTEQCAFKNFRVVILAARLLLPSHPTGTYTHISNLSPFGVRLSPNRPVAKLAPGITPDGCVVLFRRVVVSLAEEFLGRLLAIYADDPVMIANLIEYQFWFRQRVGIARTPTPTSGSRTLPTRQPALSPSSSSPY